MPNTNNDPLAGIWYRIVAQGRAYQRRGTQGVRTPDRWMNSYDSFAEDVGPHRRGMCLARLNLDMHVGWVPGNYKWMTRSEQTSINSRKQRSRLLDQDRLDTPYATLARLVLTARSALATRNKAKFKRDFEIACRLAEQALGK